MLKLITAAAALTILVACDSEGIDRAVIAGAEPDSGSVTPDDSQTPVTPVTGSDDDTTDTADDSDDNAINSLGGSGPSDGGENSTNPLGGSGSSDGGNSAAISDETDVQDDQPQETVDASLSLTPPASGTTFVSTMSPIRSDNGPLCITPMKDANGDVMFNENGNCPLVDFHGNLAFGDFLLSTNAWNFCASSFPDWEQCVSVNESAGAVAPRWDYDWGEENQVNGQVWLVKSYPEIIYGIKSPGEFSGSTLAETPAETGLPAKVADLPFFEIDYAFSSEEFPTRGKELNGQTINGERNVAVEAFFHELSGECDVTSLIRNGTESNQRFEIMVWLDSGAERLPAAPSDFVTTQTLDGVEYDIYTKPSDPEYIAFVSKTPTSSGSINWTTFVEWTRANSHRVNEVFGQGFNTVPLEDDWCMANILLGTEIWWGNGFFQADEWTITRTVR